MSRRRRSLRFAHVLWLAIPLVAGLVAYRHRRPLLEGLALLPQARGGWLALGAVMVGIVYLARAHVYRVPLRVLDYTVRARFLFAIAMVATTVHQLIPTAGASGYAFLTFALHRQGVASGQASLVALIDTVSYAVAMATLVGGSLLYLLAWVHVPTPVLRAGILPALGIVALAVFVYVAQRTPAASSRCSSSSTSRWAPTRPRSIWRSSRSGRRRSRGRCSWGSWWR